MCLGHLRSSYSREKVILRCETESAQDIKEADKSFPRTCHVYRSSGLWLLALHIIPGHLIRSSSHPAPTLVIPKSLHSSACPLKATLSSFPFSTLCISIMTPSLLVLHPSFCSSYSSTLGSSLAIPTAFSILSPFPTGCLIFLL